MPDSEVQSLVAASKHLFFPNLRLEEKNDGFVHKDNLKVAVGVDAPLVPQCDCIAHERLKDTSLTEAELDDLKAIIRSAGLRTTDAGCIARYYEGSSPTWGC